MKATANLRNHKIAFSEAATVLGDFLSRPVPEDYDTAHTTQ